MLCKIILLLNLSESGRRTIEAEGGSVAVNERPLLAAGEQLLREHLAVDPHLEQFLLLHLLHPLLEVAEEDLGDVGPGVRLEEAVEEEGHQVDAHVAHHEFVHPLVDDRLQVDAVLQLPKVRGTSRLNQAGK